MKTPLEVCEQRDVKGLYKMARQDKIKEFTGIHTPYEEPTNPEIILDTTVNSIEQSIFKVVNYLSDHVRKIYFYFIFFSKTDFFLNKRAS